MSWPYQACAGVRTDGEPCSSRAGLGSLYCHHHDPARKTSAPTSAAASPTNPLGRPGEAPSGNARPEPRMTCERCDEPAFPGRGFCAEHLLESLDLEHDGTPEERELNRRCVARGRDGAPCRDRYANRATKLCADHQKPLDGGTDFEDVLRGDLRERPSAARAAAVPARKRKNGTPPVLAVVAVTEEEHERVAATVGDILREARSTSREAIEETVALLLDARRTVNVVVPPGAKPGQVISVQVPDLKLRLDGLKFVSERVEGRPAGARLTASSENYPMPSTLAEWERLPFKYKFAFAALATIPSIERMIESNDPLNWELFAKNEISMVSLRFVLDECERMLERTA